MTEKACTVLIAFDEGEPPQVNELRKHLEAGTIQEKIEALKRVILLMLNGENLSQLLMTIIRFVLPIDDHTLKKLLLLYFEIVDKTSADGKLLSEMILVCNALRNDLMHPNEYVRGSTLRFLTKLKEPDLLEPLLPSIRLNLEYKHAYVRRNAVLALYNVYKNFESMCPDAPDLVYNFLCNEGDLSCKRNAFIMLFNCAQDKAVQYLLETLDQVVGLGDIIQMIVVELIRKVCRQNPSERSKYIKCIFNLLQSSSSSVQYEAAGTLVSLSSAPTAVKAAASTFIDLLVKESDNNVKMIVLDRLTSIKQRHSKILQELLMDILRALSCPNMDIRRKTLDLALDLVSPTNIEEVVMVLKREIQKTQSKELEKAGEYRQMLIQTIHSSAIKFPEVAGSVVLVLIEFLGDVNSGSAVDVICFLREVMEMYPNLRQSLLEKLLESLDEIKSSKVYRTSLWIIGEYSISMADIDASFTALKEIIGPLPFSSSDEENTIANERKGGSSSQAKHENSSSSTSSTSSALSASETIGGESSTTSHKKMHMSDGDVGGMRVSSTTRILSDGTYATISEPPLERGSSMSIFSSNSSMSTLPNAAKSSSSSLRALLMGGDFFLGSVLASSLTKLALKVIKLVDMEPITKNMFVSEVLLILTSIVRFGKSPSSPKSIDLDSYERIVMCIKLLTDPKDSTCDVLLRQCRESFARILDEQQKLKRASHSKQKEVDCQTDDLIKVRQLRSKKTYGIEDVEDYDDADLLRLTGTQDSQEDPSLKLNRVFQLTGFSDPIYAEAYVNVHQYDVILDFLVINQTPETLQNVALELATLGDLKLVERPQNYTIAPHDKKQIRANIKVSSTETGVIFGNIVYDIAGTSSSDKNCVILNDIHIDIMDYISPAQCSDVKFRTMWAEFEWENKVAVNTNITEVGEFLKHIIQSTNMNCLTSESALSGECNFLSANLYAKSVFGEDALANVSIEKQPDGKIGGFIRIRSKTQGIALSLGDKITVKQRMVTPGKGSN